MTLIGAHALLHQASREQDDRGRITATLDDYEVVRDLIAPLIAEGIDATVSATVRETVEAVARLLEGASEDGHAQTTAVAKELQLDHSTAYRRVRAALAKGYLRNDEARKGRPAKLRLGDSLPADREILPSQQALAPSDCTIADDFQEMDTTPPPSAR